MDKQRVVNPMLVSTYFGNAPVRGVDWGKWSDVKKFLELIGHGLVCNLSMTLSPYGSSGRFKGVEVSARVMPKEGKTGRVIINAGSDPRYDAVAEISSLASGDFDTGELPLCVLSLIDLSSFNENDLHVVITSPVLPGASLGTSASVESAFLRTFLGDSFDPTELWKLALRAEYEIAKLNTGNQDQIAAAFGSFSGASTPVQLITIRDLFDADVESIPVGPKVAGVLGNTLAAVVGQHDSSDTHQMLMAELEGDPAMAKTKLLAMRDTAEMAADAFRSDSPEALFESMEALLEAQTGLSSGLVGATHWKLIQDARHFGGASSVPGAGGEGGSVITIFPDTDSMHKFAQQVDVVLPSVRLFEAAYPGLN